MTSDFSSEVNLEEAARFLAMLGEGEHTFQYFFDKGKGGAGIRHADFESIKEDLARLNTTPPERGIFVTVNKCKGRRVVANIFEVRAVFVDLDGAPLDPVLDFELPPHMTVESSPGRYHAYWKVEGFPVDKEIFADIQSRLAKLFGGDSSVKDLSRVMRVPGFFHLKGEPYRSRILEIREGPKYSFEQLDDALPNLKKEHRETTKAKVVIDPFSFEEQYLHYIGEILSSPVGERNTTLNHASYIIGGLTTEGLPLETARQELCEAGKAVGLPEGEVEATVNSGLTAGAALEREVHQLNRRHAVVSEGGRTVVITEGFDPVLKRRIITCSSRRDFENLYANQFVMVNDGKKEKPVPLGRYWFTSPYRRQYKGIVFAPLEHVPGYFNLWRGFNVEPLEGDWSLLKDHIYSQLCRGNDEQYAYFMNWMAAVVQHPGRPGETALVLCGAQGTGKGLIARSLGQLLGQHFLHVSNPYHLTSNFNAHLRDVVLLFADEAFWAGDKAAESVLKALITEPTLLIEAKGRDAVLVHNCLHVIIASNSDWVIPAAQDERRYFVLDVSNKRAQDKAYFRAIIDQLENGGYEAMLFELLERDLTNIDLRDVPCTPALRKQKMHSLDPIGQWWLEKLERGTLLKQHTDWEETVASSGLHDDYCSAMDTIGVRRRSLETGLGRGLQKLLPDGFPIKRRLTMGGRRQYCLTLPPLSVCREHFDKITKSKWDWPSAEEEPTSEPDEIF